MKHLYYIRISIIILSVGTLLINNIDALYAYFTNKSLFVHFYLKKKKLSKQQKLFLTSNISFYKKLDDDYKEYFEHRLSMFMRNYEFIERDGFKITPEIKVLIASSYIKLTFGMRNYLTTTFDKIVVYPKEFYSAITKRKHKGEFNPAFKLIAFSWQDFLVGDVIKNDNINLGIHEFSHALTFHGQKSKDVSSTIFFNNFKKITHFLDDENALKRIKGANYFRNYAFTNKLEFMAVVLQHFFETPEELKKAYPKLYKDVVVMLNYKSIGT